MPYSVVAAHLGQEMALPPRQRGTDGDDVDALGEAHAPIGLSRQDSGSAHFYKEALARNASAFTESSTESAADGSGSELNAD